MGYSVIDLACIAEKICLGCGRRKVETRRRCDACRQKLNARDRERHSLATQLRRRLKGLTERKTRSYTWAKQQEAKMRSSQDVIKALKAMGEARRKQVEAIVKRHIEACQRHGVRPESIDQVWIEAIQQAEMEQRAPRETEAHYEPTWKYQQYVSPTSEGY